MVLRRFHYDKAFEHYLRLHAIPYVAVDEAKRTLVSRQTLDNVTADLCPPPKAMHRDEPKPIHKLKSFDFVVYRDQGSNLLVDVKGRKFTGKWGRSFQNWVTQDDIDDLQAWSNLFGPGFEPALMFLFWCADQPPDALFLDVFSLSGRWYAVQMVTLADYKKHMRPRSSSWNTVSVPAKDFQQIAQSLTTLRNTPALGRTPNCAATHFAAASPAN